jgi:hypothetical protein
VSALPETWVHTVSGNGIDKDMSFRYYWIDLEQAGKRLSARYGDPVGLLVSKIKEKSR